MFWTLVVTACLGYGPCKDFNIDSGQPSQWGCGFMAQIAMVEFISEHPKWRIAGYKCLPPGSRIGI